MAFILLSGMRMRLPVLATLLAASSLAQAAPLTFSWTANSEPDIAGYKLYYDVDSGAPYTGSSALEGASPIDIPLANLADPANPKYVIHVPSCVKLYAAVTAYNALESDYSNEASKTPVAIAEMVTATPLPSAALQGIAVGWSPWPLTDAGGLSTYRLYYGAQPGGPYDLSGAAEGASPIALPASSFSAATAPSVLLTELPGGQPIYVVLESVCPDGTSKLSAEASAMVPSAPDATSDGGTPPDPGSAPDGAAPPSDGGASSAAPGAGMSDAEEDIVSLDAPPAPPSSSGCSLGADRRPAAGGALGLLLVAGLALLRQRRANAQLD